MVVVDAAQLRVDSSVAGAWIDSGYWVLITVSKFIGGVSFSGALLVLQGDAEISGATNAILFPSDLVNIIASQISMSCLGLCRKLPGITTK